MVPSHERIAMRALIAVAVLGLSLTAAQAGPGSEKIAQFEQAVRQSAGNPNAGPMARQTIGAQLDRQPTPASVKRAQERAQSTFAANLARAKRLDAQGNRAGCTRAPAPAQRKYKFFRSARPPSGAPGRGKKETRHGDRHEKRLDACPRVRNMARRAREIVVDGHASR